MRKENTLRFDLLSGEVAAAVLLGLLFLLGGVVGCIIAGGIGGTAGTALQEYLQSYFKLAQEQGIEVSFWPVAWEQFRDPLLILFFGFTAVGILGIPVLFAVRGFLFAFSVACFCRLFGWAGLMPAGVLFGLPALMWAPAWFVLGSQSMCSSYTLLLGRTGERCSPLAYRGRYWLRNGLCAGTLVLCAVFEALILPALVEASAGFVL